MTAWMAKYIWVVISMTMLIGCVGFAAYLAHDIRTHPERTYAIACNPQYFVRMFSVGEHTFAVCGSPPYNDVGDFKIVKMPD